MAVTLLASAHIVELMAVADREGRAYGSFPRRMWGEAFDQLSAAHREGQLDAEDLERLAVAAYMVGRDAGELAGDHLLKREPDQLEWLE